MCGRFARTSSTHRFAELFRATVAADLKPSYNIPPGSALLVARAAAGGGRERVTMKWGLVPAWSAEPKTPYSTINARAETVAEKPAFRAAFKHRRCLIAADGWLDPTIESAAPLQPLLAPGAEDLLYRYPVSRLVNSRHNDGRDLIEPLDVWKECA